MSEFILNISPDNQILNSKVIWEEFRKLSPGKHLVKTTSIKRRSLPQNKYYWSCVVPLVREGLVNAGYDEIKTNEQAHDIMKHLFLKKQMVSKKDGNVIEIAGSTAALTALEFSNYLEDIYKWSSEYLNTYIPPPSAPMPLYSDIMVAYRDPSIKSTIIEK